MPDSFDYSVVNSENAQLLQAIIDDAPSYTKETGSRNAEILKSIINDTEYTDAPQSEIEELLLELKEKIAGGGGDITVESLNVTENGTYQEEGKAYSPVVVNVPTPENSYQLKSIENTPTDIATFNASALPMPSLTVGIEATQSGSGDPSPTNVRPISGWSAVNVYDTGKNICPTQENLWEQGSISSTTGGETPSTTRVRTIGYYPIKNDTDYHITARGGYCFVNILFYDTNKTYIGDYYSIYALIYGATDLTINIPSANLPNVAYYKTTIRNVDNTSTVVAHDIEEAKPQIELGTTATTYEAYNGQTYTTTLKDGQGNPMESYGGQLENKNGVQTLTNETKIVVLDGSSDEVWEYYRGGFYIESVFIGINGLTSKTSPKCMCNMYKEENAIQSSTDVSNREDYSFFNQTENFINRLWVKDSRYSTAEDFKTALASQPLQIRYTIATLVEIPQDNLAISTQDGTNNIWADSGDVIEGEYFSKL